MIFRIGDFFLFAVRIIIKNIIRIPLPYSLENIASNTIRHCIFLSIVNIAEYDIIIMIIL